MTDDDLVHAALFDWTGRKRERVVRCFLGKIYMTSDGRNAWYSTWVQRYQWDGFYASLKRAQRSVEPRRVQGSTWKVQEVPAVVVSGVRTASYIFEINSPHPFDFEPPNFGSAITVSSLTDRWGPLAGHQVFQRVAPAPAGATAALPFYRHTSQSSGRNYYLGWKQWPNDIRIDGAMAHISALASHLQRHL